MYEPFEGLDIVISVWVTGVHSLKIKLVFLSFTADQVFDTGDHEPVRIASTSMIEHIAIPPINQTFDAIGKTPLDPKRVKLKSYGERKLRQLQADVRETLQMNKPKDDFEEFGVLCCLTTPGLRKDIRRQIRQLYSHKVTYYVHYN